MYEIDYEKEEGGGRRRRRRKEEKEEKEKKEKKGKKGRRGILPTRVHSSFSINIIYEVFIQWT